MERRGRPTYSFALIATLTTVFLVVAVALGLAFFGYDTLAEIESRALHDRFALLYRGASNYLKESVRAVSIAQRTMSVHFTRDPDGPPATAPTREPYRALAAFAREFPMLTAAYAGFDDGSFVYYADLRHWSPELRAAVSAPALAVGTIRYIGPNGADAWQAFYDKGGADILTVPSPPHNIDPRIRPWYRDAMGAPSTILTKPYRFATTRQLGLTIATKLPSGDGVVAADMTLDDIVRLAGELRVSPSSVVVFFTRDGWIMGHGYEHKPRNGRAGTAAATSPKVMRLADTGSLLLEQLTRLGLAPKPEPELTDDAGRQYLIEAAPIGTAVGTELYLGVAAPVDEMDMGLRRRIVLFAVIAFGGLLFGALMAVLSARVLSRPIARLGGEARQLAALDFADPPPTRSRVSEVRDLADALGRARHALRTFGTYVPRQLVDRLIRHPDQARLAGERRRLSLMFTDIAEFSAIAEQLDPEELMARTSAYFERVGRIIEAHDGIIDKFIGDAVMAIWNAPDPDPDHVGHCCRTALAVAAALGAFNRDAEQSGAPRFRTRIGIHTGDCVIGNVGSSDRVSYTAMGAAVNLASRVEGLNGLYGTTVLATGAVVEAAAPRFLFRWIDRVIPVGMTEGIDVYELLAERPDADGVLDPRLARLVACWDEAASHYRAQRFGDAAAAYRAVLSAFPDDGPARVLADRAARFAGQGAPADWTGTFRASAKKT